MHVFSWQGQCAKAKYVHDALHAYLREPPREVVHDDGCNEGLAQACRQAHQGVVQESCLDDGQLVAALLGSERVHPRPRIHPAACCKI